MPPKYHPAQIIPSHNTNTVAYIANSLTVPPDIDADPERDGDQGDRDQHQM